MNISWQYLDKRNATINALKDYAGMKHILSHTDGESRAPYKPVEEIVSPMLSGLPGNSPSGEVGDMDRMDVLSARFQQATEYMNWFQPGWDALSEDERFVLTQFYQCEENKQINNVYEICDRYHIERSTAYKKKDRALAHLSLLLYGK